MVIYWFRFVNKIIMFRSPKMKKMFISVFVLVFGLISGLGLGNGFASSSRDYISVVGSSTVYPFATVVAEQFGKSTSFKTPKIE